MYQFKKSKSNEFQKKELNCPEWDLGPQSPAYMAGTLPIKPPRQLSIDWEQIQYITLYSSTVYIGIAILLKANAKSDTLVNSTISIIREFIVCRYT